MEKITPIQELINEFELLKKTKLYQGSFKAIDDCIHLAYAKIEVEKFEIIEHGVKCYSNCCGEPDRIAEIRSEEIYNYTFKP
jgi:hypothetical protein